VVGVPVAEARGDQDLHRPAEQIGARVAEQLLGLRVDQDHPPLVVDDDHRVGRRLEQVAELRLHLLAVGDVADRGGDQRRLLGLHRREADLGRELAAVLAAAEELEPSRHRPRLRLAEVPGPAPRVHGAELLRHQDLDRLAQQLVAPVAEQLLGLMVDEVDDAVGVDDDHRVRGRFEEAAKPGLQRALLAQPLELGDVLLVGHHEARVALRPGHDAHRHVDVDERAVLAAAHGFEHDAAPAQRLVEHGARLGDAVGGDDELVEQAVDDFRWRVAEDRLGPAVPEEHLSLRRQRDQRVRRFLDQLDREGVLTGSPLVAHRTFPPIDHPPLRRARGHRYRCHHAAP
jgi:hypothetical protein